MGKLDGKIAIVTGASGGIGGATAQKFVEEGARVVLTDVNASAGQELANKLGSDAFFIKHDVTKAAEWSRVVSDTERQFGPVTVLVNNAGISQSGVPLLECSDDDYRRIIDVDQFSIFLGMKAVLPAMVKAGQGSIVNISSVMGLVGIAGSIAYVAAKFAVTGMTKVAALEFGGAGIRVNSVHPGLTNTPMVAVQDAAMQALLRDFAESRPLGRLAEAREMADMIAFLASEESSYCTGAAFSADGGWSTS